MKSTLIALSWITITVATSAATLPRVTALSAEASATAHGASFAPTFSADGRYVVFVSQNKSLAANSRPSPWLDVFRHDLELGTTELVSVSTNGIAGGNGDSRHPTISSNGQFIAFSSEASNLVANAPGTRRAVFLRDMVSGEISLLSVTTNRAPDYGDYPVISADGARVVFQTSYAEMLGSDIVLRDRAFESNLSIAINHEGTGRGIGRGSYQAPGGSGTMPLAYSAMASMSEDGRFVAFHSDATNLVADAAATNGGVFLRDMAANVTYWASAGVDDPALVVGSTLPAILSSNGRAVFFGSRDLMYNRLLHKFDLAAGTNFVVATNIAFDSPASCDGDGRYAVVATASALSIVDTIDGTSQIICGEGVAPEIVEWRAPKISRNAQCVTFAARTNANGSWFPYLFTRSSGSRQLVFLDTNGAPAEIEAMAEPVISGDGRRVACESRSVSLVPYDFNSASDIFVRDLEAETTHLVSRRMAFTTTSPAGRSLSENSVAEFGKAIAFTSHDQLIDTRHDNRWRSAFVHNRVAGNIRVLATPESRALGSNRLAFNPVISANGRFAAWLEQAVQTSNTPGTATNIFWLDLETGTSRAVSCRPVPFAGRNSGSSGPYSQNVFVPALSSDGRWLAFAAAVPGNAYWQVFQRDMFSASSTNILLSHVVTGPTPGNGDSWGPQFSPDGRWVVYFSRALNTVTNSPVVGPPIVVARDMVTGKKYWVSTAGNGYPLFDLVRFRISGNSRFVFIQTTASTGANLYRHDLSAGTSTNIGVFIPVTDFSPSADGNIVAFRDLTRNIWVHDIAANATGLISSNAVACCNPANGNSLSPLITGDSRFVIYASGATNLVSDDTNNAMDIFVHDRRSGTTMLVSRHDSGAPGKGSSSTPLLAPDGRTVVFSSSATDLVAGDFNQARDIFVLRLGGEDLDLDGMDDEWEITHFSNLARSGFGDFDGDGASDRHEFDAGTDPTNSGSVFSVFTVERSGGNRLVLWRANLGSRYRLEYKNSVQHPYWEPIATVTASGTTASFLDTAAASQRFYRVVLLP